jgi:hypothetical protein
MNNSNNYNICPRCGTANSLSSKFCFQCGAALKVPEEPIVCPTCKRINSSLANFCLSCGTPLKVGGESKICPRCGKEVVADQTVCNCGYRFGPIRQVNPSREAVDPRTGAGYPAAATTAVEDVKPASKAAGRVMAAIAAVLALVIAYVYYSTTGFLSGEGFIYNIQSNLFGGDIFGILSLYKGGCIVMPTSLSEYLVVGIQSLNTLTIGNWIALGFVALCAAVLVAYFVVNIVRIFSGKRSKRANIILLIVAILSTLLTILVLLDSETRLQFPSTVLNWLFVLDGYYVSFYSIGFVFFAIAFWVLFLYSVICKRKKNLG